MPPTICDSHGRQVALGPVVGKGGEGTVYEIRHTATVAKLYHNPLLQEKADKLAAMVRLRTDELAKFAAWPVDLLFAPTQKIPVGLAMPAAAAACEIHELSGVKSRLARFQNADFRFVTHSAANLARVFAAVHHHGHVIGDVNEKNFLVTPQATVCLIDCDSIQVRADDRTYLCEVGVDNFTPPELQGVRFNQVERTVDHDAFGLAVLMFQLLLLGRHPFAGRFLAPGEMPIAKAIAERRFAYGPGARSRSMSPPPNVVDLDSLPPSIGTMFERAFTADGPARPTPNEWLKELGDLASSLRRCGRDDVHFYWSGADRCPWCAFEKSSGITVFGSGLGVDADRLPAEFAELWARILAIPDPGPVPAIPPPPTVRPSSHLARQAGARGWVDSVLSSVGLNARRAEARRSLCARIDLAEARTQDLISRLKSEGANTEFQTALSELKKVNAGINALPTLRQRKLEQHASDQRGSQLAAYLDGIDVCSAEIPGLDPGKLSALRSYAVETAGDITSAALIGVPGFGPAEIELLVEWRRSVEKAFRYDPNRATDHRDSGRVEREVQSIRQKYYMDLSRGQTELEAIAARTLQRRQALLSELREAQTSLAQLRADLKVT